MNLQSLLNSTTPMLLLTGLGILFLNVIFSAIRLSRGHARAGIISVVLALGACALIAVGLVRMTFPALAGVNPSPAAAAFAGSGGASAQQGNTSVTSPLQTPGASGRAAIQTQIAQGTVPARRSGQNSSGSFAGQSGGQAGQTSGQGGGQTGGRTGQNTSQTGQASGQGGGQASASAQTGQGGGTPAGITSSAATIPASRLAAVTVIGAAVILLAGLILYFGERRRPGFEPSSSAGLLYAGAGVFVLVAALVVPGLPGQFSVARASGVAIQPTDSGSTRVVRQTASPTVTPVPSATPTDLPTLTPVPSESPTPLFTPVAYTGSSDVSTTTACSVTAQTALNLRGDPSTQQMAIGKVFAGSILAVTGQTADKKWWRVISGDGGSPVEGWVSTDFVTTMSGCADDPVPVVGPTLTPTRTARPSATPRP
jgi:Bacterial SH3 domain